MSIKVTDVSQPVFYKFLMGQMVYDGAQNNGWRIRQYQGALLV